MSAYVCLPCNRRRHMVRGVTLVDMLIGLAIGLFIVSQGLIMLAAHLHENKRLVIESRLMQDLRTAAAMIDRDLRRAGHWRDATAALWREDTPTRANPYQVISMTSGVSDTVRLHYSRDVNENHAVDGNEAFGFRLRNHAIDALLGGSWQTLTDATTVRVTSLRLTPLAAEVDQPMACDKPCPPAAAGAAACPPRILVRQFELAIDAESPIDPAIRRSLQATTRVRNDAAIGACPP
ncbi:hypothetical protein [Piscinibacter sakaiensis]|uniref:hypothetical protein n=1 Tax=Piscinibacter sakaiensis TaxID=1547922 RepID=UPI003AABD41D